MTSKLDYYDNNYNDYCRDYYNYTTTTTTGCLRVTSKLDGFLDVRLVLRRRLDRETNDVFHLRLAAFDGGQPALHEFTHPQLAGLGVTQPALHDVVNVTVKVLDSNDNDPVFERSRYEPSRAGCDTASSASWGWVNSDLAMNCVYLKTCRPTRAY